MEVPRLAFHIKQHLFHINRMICLPRYDLTFQDLNKLDSRKKNSYFIHPKNYNVNKLLQHYPSLNRNLLIWCVLQSQLKYFQVWDPCILYLSNVSVLWLKQVQRYKILQYFHQKHILLTIYLINPRLNNNR